MSETAVEARSERASDIGRYRDGLRAWLAEGHADAWRESYRSTPVASMSFNADLVKLLYATEWGRYGWPAEAGGLGGDVRHLAVLFDELSRRGIPIPEQYGVLQVLGPPLVHYSPELASSFLGSFLKGDDWWGQSFSEPEAGSDLAALRCRATAVDGGYELNGQKLWTSHGVGASRIVVLARTGSQESRHRGLSMFLVDADTPGVTIRPIALSNGREELAEVFLDGAFVPVDRRIGQESDGWGITMYLMQYERGLWAWLRSTVLMFRLSVLARSVTVSDTARQRIGEAYLDLAALRSRSAETVNSLADGDPVGPEASVDKLLLGIAETGLLDTARELLGDDFIFGSRSGIVEWREEWWWSRTTTIYGGSAEVQRQILADKVLNLPRETSR